MQRVEAHQLVAVYGAGVDYSSDGKDDSGGRSSAKRGCGAAARRRVNGGARHHLKGSKSTSKLLREAEVLGGTELAGHGGRRLQVLAGQLLWGTREREMRGERKRGSQRTRRAVQRARGSFGCREDDDGDPRRPRPKTTMVASLRASHRRELHLGAPWRLGGASGQHGEARERRWPRLCSAMATTALGGCVREI